MVVTGNLVFSAWVALLSRLSKVDQKKLAKFCTGNLLIHFYSFILSLVGMAYAVL